MAVHPGASSWSGRKPIYILNGNQNRNVLERSWSKDRNAFSGICHEMGIALVVTARPSLITGVFV